MDRVFDIHNHIMPGVDDGSKDMEMSLKMLRMARQEGITDVILTPHNKPRHKNVTLPRMQELVTSMEEAMLAEGIDITLHLGNELYYHEALEEWLEQGLAATMCQSRYILLEFIPSHDWAYIEAAVHRMINAGYIVIVAHVERYDNVMSDMKRAAQLVEMGAYLQINAPSVMGEVDFKTKRHCKYLLKNGLVSFVATDAHEPVKRRPALRECIRYIEKKYGSELCEDLFYINPQKILHNEFI